MTNSHTVDELYIKFSSITKTVLILVASTNLYIFQHDPKGRVTLDLFCAYTTSFNIFCNNDLIGCSYYQSDGK